MYNAIKLCLKLVVIWLSDFLRKPQHELNINPIQQFDSPPYHLWRFHRQSPAEVVSWMLKVDGFDSIFFIFLDNLKSLELITKYKSQGQKYDRLQDVEGFEGSRAVKRTHLISFEWVISINSNTGIRGNKKRIARRIGYYVADLQSINLANTNKAAYELVSYLANHFYNIRVDKELREMSVQEAEIVWRKRIESVDYGKLIIELAANKKVLPKHDIRLKRVDTKVKEVTRETRVKF